MSKKWIALFSKTGSELRSVSDILKREPDVVFSNNKNISISLFENLIIADPKTIYSQIEAMDPNEVFITLNGWLRIVPPTICEQYECYNIHPGDIITFPELKGIDPQIKALKLNLPYTCNVIHKVTPGVDEGEILCYSPSCPILPGDTEYSLSSKLHVHAINLWTSFLKKTYYL